MYYFAYGSNMDPERMRERLGRLPERKAASLAGWILKFNKIASRNPREGYANIMQQNGAVTEGILYDITDAETGKLDVKEGYPDHYNKVALQVRLGNDTEVRAMTYVAQHDKVNDSLKPSRDYLRHLLADMEFLSEGYIRKLEAVETID